MYDIDKEWNDFLISKNSAKEIDDNISTINLSPTIREITTTPSSDIIIPKPSELYISTKSKISYLNQPIDLSVFWKIDIIPYSYPGIGIIKKQMKVISNTQDELDFLKHQLQSEKYFEENVIRQMSRIKFKDVRKISIGLSKKDIIDCGESNKKKHAFDNCFVLIIRCKIGDNYKEFHVKLFNTGKIEIPGIQYNSVFVQITEMIRDILQPFTKKPIILNGRNDDIILINSNFNCGFYIDRERLIYILKKKYNLQAIYDPCNAYPGIQCKFYYDKSNPLSSVTSEKLPITQQHSGKSDNIRKISFMIFRTGSVLIVGKCEEYVLMDCYNFVKTLLQTEYHDIVHNCNADNIICDKIVRKRNIRKRNVIINASVIQKT